MATPDRSSVSVSNVTKSGVLGIDSVLAGREWGSQGHQVNLSFSFTNPSSPWAKSYSAYAENTSAGYASLSTAQKAAAYSALSAWSNVSGVHFLEVTETKTNVGDIRFSAWQTNNGSMAHAYLPSSSAAAGDVWLNNSVSAWATAAQPGTYANYALIHEMGHALGLKHSFEASGTNNTVLVGAQDTIKNTVMSYSAINGDPNSWVNYYPTTPMLFDIAAMGYMYGANSTFHAGDDVYTFKQGQKYFQTLYDAGGNDTIVWDASTQGATIDLRPGAWSDLGDSLEFHSKGQTIQDNFTVALYYTTVIENAIGGDAADILIGNAANNVINGRGGNDVIYGDAGDDILLGGAGNDTLYGGVGNDILDGGSGNDTMFGGQGNDIYYVDSANDKVVENPNEGTDMVITTLANYSLPSNVENVSLLASKVTFTGNALDNVIYVNAGSHTIDGGAGRDTISYANMANSNKGIKIDLNITGAQQTGVGTDILKNIENIQGSANNDVLIGNAGNNILDGYLGSDTLQGGAGADVFRFSSTLGPQNVDTIVDFNVLEDKIELDHLIFSAIKTLGTLNVANFASGAGLTQAKDSNDYIIYDTRGGGLYYDPDGVGGSGSIQFAVVTGAPALTERSFVIS